LPGISGAAAQSPAAAAIAAGPDPILVALAEFHRIDARTYQADRELDDAEGRLSDEDRLAWPSSLVEWRQYSAIGWSEIERVRDEFLALPDTDEAMIWQEYREVKAAEQASRQAQRQWYQVHGLTELKAKADGLHEQRQAAEEVLAKTQPVTPAGAAALISLIYDEMSDSGDAEWHLPALRNSVSALRNMRVQS